MICREYARLYTAARPLVVAANKLVREQVKVGNIPHPATLCCVDCGGEAHCYDHRDYTKPLAIEPVCRSCNRLRGPGHPYIGLPSLTDKKARGVRKPHVMRRFAHLNEHGAAA